MPTESILFDPNVDERGLDQEVDEVNERLHGVGEDIPVSFDDSGMDGLVPDAGGDGGGGVPGGGAAGAAGLASRIPKSVAGVTAAAALPVALTGSAGLGILDAMRSSSARLQTSESILSQAWTNIWRPLGDKVDQLFIRDPVLGILSATEGFEDAFRNADWLVDPLARTLKNVLTGGPVGGGQQAAEEIIRAIEGVNLGKHVPQFSWPDLPTFDWPSLPRFRWPSIPDFDWPSLPRFSWPTVPSPPGWPAFPSPPSWPNIPSFPGWPGIPKPDMPDWTQLSPGVPDWRPLSPGVPDWTTLAPDMPDWSGLNLNLPDWLREWVSGTTGTDPGNDDPDTGRPPETGNGGNGGGGEPPVNIGPPAPNPSPGGDLAPGIPDSGRSGRMARSAGVGTRAVVDKLDEVSRKLDDVEAAAAQTANIGDEEIARSAEKGKNYDTDPMANN